MRSNFIRSSFLILVSIFLVIINFYSRALLAERTDGEVLKIADEIIGLIREGNFQDLSEYINDKKGLRISPYDDGFNKFPGYLTLSKSQVRDFMEDKKLYTWGFYDGSGDDIKLTSKDYYKRFIYVVDFKNKAEVILLEGATSKNSKHFKYFFHWFPRSKIVQYHYKGTPENYHLDFHRLNLVFEKNDNKWFLIGIMHGEKTV